MTQDEIIEMAIQGHASTRDTIRWAINQERERMTVVAMDAAEKAVDVAIKLEREACAKLCEDSVEYAGGTLADAIRARGQA